MTPLKIDPFKLNELLQEGASTNDIASYFGVTPGAISHAKKRLSVALVKASAEKNKALDSANKAAPVIIKTADDAKFRLSEGVSWCLTELKWIKSAMTAQKAACDYCIFQETAHVAQNDYRRSFQETALKHVAEIRKLISTISDIEYKLHHVATVEKALLLILEEIGHESKACQKRIRDRLERSSILLPLDS